MAEERSANCEANGRVRPDDNASSLQRIGTYRAWIEFNSLAYTQQGKRVSCQN